MPGTQRKYIRGLDGLRAISVIMVIASHFSSETFFERHPVLGDAFSGATGVNFFFVISGFLITSLLLREQDEFGGIDFVSFYARRALRIIPALLLFLGACIVLMATGFLAKSPVNVVYGSLYIYNFLPRAVQIRQMSHLWSLAVEEHFYLLWPIFLAFIPRRVLTVTTAAVVAFCGCLFVWIDLHWFRISDTYVAHHFTIPSIGLILIGCCLALVGVDRGKAWISFALGMALYLCPSFLPPEIAGSGRLIQALGCGLFIRGIVAEQGLWVVSALEYRPLRYIGRISYGLYLWHGIFVPPESGAVYWFRTAPWNIALSLVCAVLSYELLERPCLRYRNRWRREAKLSSGLVS